MKTFTAQVKATVNGINKNLMVEIRATSSAEAKWLLQAIYGFHAVSSSPTEVREVLAQENLSQPQTPEQQRITSLKATKDRASDALNAERERQKRSKALKILSTIPTG